jgi:hypothetical protein
LPANLLKRRAETLARLRGSNNCSAAIPGGCIRSLDVTGNIFPTLGTVNHVVLAAGGGTTSISVDNVNLSAGASSV